MSQQTSPFSSVAIIAQTSQQNLHPPSPSHTRDTLRKQRLLSTSIVHWNALNIRPISFFNSAQFLHKNIPHTTTILLLQRSNLHPLRKLILQTWNVKRGNGAANVVVFAIFFCNSSMMTVANIFAYHFHASSDERLRFLDR